MKRSFWVSAIIFMWVSIFLTGSCKKDKNDTPSSITPEQIQAIKTGYSEVSATLDDAMLSDDPVTAFYASLDDIKTKTAVEDAWTDSSSFYVKFKNGGAIIWNIVSEIDTSSLKSVQKKTLNQKHGDGNPVLVGNKDVCILNQQFEDENRPYNLELVDHLYDTYSNAGFTVTIKNGEQVDLAFIDNYLSDFGTIFYISHGGYDQKDDLTWISTGEKAGDLPIDSIVHKYHPEWVANQVAIFKVKELTGGVWKSVPVYAFSEEFINARIPDGIFPQSIIYLVACKGATDPDKDLQQTFVAKGAGSVIGWNEINCLGQATGQVLFDYLLEGYTVGEIIDYELTQEQKWDYCSGRTAKIEYFPNPSGGDYCVLNNRPVITTNTVWQITTTTATSGGNIVTNGGLPILVRGVCWSTSPSPTIYLDTTKNGSGEGDYRSYLKGLLPSTQYYIRAYATNSKMTSYGNELTFTTAEGNLAVVTTYQPSEYLIHKSSVICGGKITDDGGSPITSRGFCWGTQSNPTLYDNNIVVGSGIGAFSDTITGLTPLTTYYMRAFAINSSDVAYGNEVQFTTKQFDLGDNYGGGIIAYFLTENDPGYVPGEQHGLIVAPSDQTSNALWGCSGTGINGTLPDVGSGQANTTAIVTGCAEPGIAARICDDLALNGFDDWFLPSSYELSFICDHKDIIGGLSMGYYWSSTNNFASLAEALDFQNGCLRSDIDKNTPCFVRAVRAF